MSHPMPIPVTAMASAASYLEHEWDETRTIAQTDNYLVGTDTDNTRVPWHVFLCGASDGGRWYIAADRWGNTVHSQRDNLRELYEAIEAFYERRALHTQFEVAS